MKQRILTYHLPAQGNCRVLVATDVHYEAGRTFELGGILTAAREQKPGVIIIAGDFINYLDDIRRHQSRIELATFLIELSAVAPVYVGVGNHDLMYRDRNYDPSRAAGELQEYLDFMHWAERQPGARVTLLHNQRSQIAKDINLIGLTLPRGYYQRPGSAATYESEAKLRQVLSENSALLHRQYAKETNLLLVHSPRRFSPAVVNSLTGIDYIITGHMHQGCMPLGLDEKLPSSLGIIAPGYQPLPRRARGKSKKPEKLIILPAYKTFAQWRRAANPLFPKSLSLLDLSKGL